MKCYEIFASCSATGEWFIEFPAFRNLFASGATLAEARAEALRVVVEHVTLLISQGFPVPNPIDAIAEHRCVVLPSIVVVRIALHNASVGAQHIQPGA